MPATLPAHVGTDSLIKPHNIITLRFSEAVKDHANEVQDSEGSKFRIFMFDPTSVERRQDESRGLWAK